MIKRVWRRGSFMMLLLASAVLTGCGVSATPTSVPAPTSLPSATANRHATAAASPTASPTSLPSSTATSTPSPTATLGPPPQVMASYPVDGDRAVLADRALLLRFDQPMDQLSVAANLTISPSVAGALTWPEANLCRFEPVEPWVAEVDYVWSLGEGALAMAGGRLAAPMVLHFETGGPGAPVPILMYHHILTLQDDASEGQRTWTVSPEALAEQIAYLDREGWQSIMPNQLADYLALGSPLPPRSVMLTFDDGYKELDDVVMPLFEPTGLRPVLFIVPEYLGYGAYLDWEQLADLVQAGCVVGAHGYDHSNLRDATDDVLKHQIVDSQQILNERLGVTVEAFCYAYGSYSERALALLSEAGYRTAYTLNPTVYQHPDCPLQLGRLLVHYDMPLESFIERLP